MGCAVHDELVGRSVDGRRFTGESYVQLVAFGIIRASRHCDHIRHSEIHHAIHADGRRGKVDFFVIVINICAVLVWR